MAAIEEALEPGDETLLRDILTPLQDEYDYILLDSPPGKAQLAFNAILAADWLLITASAERMALDGVADLIWHVQEILWRKYPDELANQEIRILFTKYKKSASHSPGIVKAATRVYRNNVLDILIPETIEFPRSYSQRQPLTCMLPGHPGAQAYQQLAQWIVGHIT
jgi:chromosome partitioning protein